MLQPRRKTLMNIKKVHDVIIKEDPETNKGMLNQEQRLLGLLQGRQQTMISKLCASERPDPNKGRDPTKFTCSTRTGVAKNFSSKAKANVIYTIVTDVLNHLEKVATATQPTSLQSHRDEILNIPHSKVTVYELKKLLTADQVKKQIKTRRDLMSAKKKEVAQLDRNISETEEEIKKNVQVTKATAVAPGITKTGRKKKTPKRFKLRGSVPKKTRKQLDNDLKKQLSARNKAQKVIKSLESEPNVKFEYIDTLDFKDEIKTKFHMLNLFKGLNNAKKSRLLLLSNEKNDKIKSELKNILLASENQAA